MTCYLIIICKIVYKKLNNLNKVKNSKIDCISQDFLFPSK